MSQTKDSMLQDEDLRAGHPHGSRDSRNQEHCCRSNFRGEGVQVILITSPKTTSSELMLVTRMKVVITCSARRVAVLVIVCIVRIQQMQD